MSGHNQSPPRRAASADLLGICRLGALPFACVHDLRVPAVARTLDLVHDTGARLDSARVTLSGQLFTQVGGTADPALRSQLLQLRRDIHNGRVPRLPSTGLPPHLRAALREYSSLCAAYAALRQQWTVCWATARAHSRTLLKGYLANDAFRRGLVLSSTSQWRLLRGSLCSRPTTHRRSSAQRSVAT